MTRRRLLPFREKEIPWPLLQCKWLSSCFMRMMQNVCEIFFESINPLESIDSMETAHVMVVAATRRNHLKHRPS